MAYLNLLKLSALFRLFFTVCPKNMKQARVGFVRGKMNEAKNQYIFHIKKKVAAEYFFIWYKMYEEESLF